MITTEIHNRVAHLTIDDGNLNVITPVMAVKLLQAVSFIESNRDVNTLYIEGNGRSFSAGLDTETLKLGGSVVEKLLADTGQLLRKLYASRLRVVSLCSGHAAAAGAMLLLVSDYRVGVSQSGRIGFSEVANGIALPELTIALARDRLNPREFYAATVLSRMYSPDEAAVAGFLDVCLTNYRDARYHALREADALSGLNDEAYLTTLMRVRGDTLARHPSPAETIES